MQTVRKPFLPPWWFIRAASGDEHARLWSEMRRREPNLDGYAAMRSRETAVVVFEPRPQPQRA